MIEISRALLPVDGPEIDRTLQEYFAFERVPRWRTAGPVIEVELSAPPSWDYYVDPKIREVLHDLAPEIGLAEVGSASLRFGRFNVPLIDSFTLLAWSRWLERRRDRAGTPAHVLLLHVDDHDDLMSPRVLIEETRMYDAITGSRISLTNPASVAAAIDSGSIGMGSFIAPLLWEMPQVQIRHLAAQPPVNVVPVEASFTPDVFLAPGKPRLEIVTSTDSEARHSYERTPSLTAWLNDLPDWPMLLHLDLDYFNNRFDGDSAWYDRKRIHDPPAEKMGAAVDALFDNLVASGALDRIEDVSIAVSVGFFPAEYWSPTLERIVDRLKDWPTRDERSDT